MIGYTPLPYTTTNAVFRKSTFLHLSFHVQGIILYKHAYATCMETKLRSVRLLRTTKSVCRASRFPCKLACWTTIYFTFFCLIIIYAMIRCHTWNVMSSS
jgi:hypothetical protein